MTQTRTFFAEKASPKRRYWHTRKMLQKVKPWECEICHTKDKLTVHHMDRNPSNNDISNLIILCRSCHEALHIPLQRLKGYVRHADNRAVENELAKWNQVLFVKKFGEEE